MSCARKQRPTEKNNLRSTGLLQRCLLFPIIPPPFWTLSNQCGEMDGPANGGKGRLAEDKAEGPNTADKEKAANTAEASDAAKEADNSIHNTGKTCPYPGPATWLSVIGVNRFWPLAYLTRETPKAPQVDPRTTKDSRHFTHGVAGRGRTRPSRGSEHTLPARVVINWLLFSGSCCVAFIAIVAGWGSGVFSIPATGLPYSWYALFWAAFAWLMAWGSVLAYSHRSRKLARDLPTPLLALLCCEG